MSIQHRLATPVIQPRMRFFDTDGKPLVGGKVYAFKVGTEEFKPTYRNSEFTALNTNPVILDGAGSALIYLRGANLLKIYDRHGNFIEERIEYQQRERAQFYDDYGRPLKNGYVYTYDYQSTIRKTSYSIDNVINPNPIVLDENGTALVNIVGAYRLRQYNSKNVFVGDQDFKRPPTKALTSLTYPIYQLESLQSRFTAINTISIDPVTNTENIESNFTVSNAQYVSEITYVTLPYMPIEHIKSDFEVLSAQYMYEVTYNSISAPIESVSSEFSVSTATIKSALVSFNAEPESISSSFNVLNAQYIEEN